MRTGFLLYKPPIIIQREIIDRTKDLISILHNSAIILHFMHNVTRTFVLDFVYFSLIKGRALFQPTFQQPTNNMQIVLINLV